MRIRLAIRCKPGTFLPFNYNAFANAMILEKIKFADSEYAQEIHDSRGFKFFTFSNIQISQRKVDKERGGLVILSDTVSLFLSSPRERFIKAFLSGILSRPRIILGSAEFELEGAMALAQPGFLTGRAVFRTMTPIVASTMREMGGKLRTWDLMPHDTQFYNNIRNNMLSKYKELYGKLLEDTTMRIKVIKQLRPKRIRVKNEFHVGCMMVFEASGSRELLELAYECGIGERNSMGFGMVEVI